MREVDSARLGCASTVAICALKMIAVKNPRKTIRFIFMFSGVVVYYTPESGQSFAFYGCGEQFRAFPARPG